MAASAPPPPPRPTIDLGLQRMRELVDRLGNPQRAYGVVHVTGTNGKGSVCAFLESSLLAAGLRTGRFVSPFLREPRDAVTVNGECVTATQWHAALADVSRQSAPAGPDQLTTFEAWTTAALLLFQRANVEVAVVEVGVGGRTDATNIVEAPLCCAITSLGLDHVGLLGGTLRDIAWHKAGIIKAGALVVVPPRLLDEDAEAAAVIRDEAAQVGAKLVAAPALHWRDRDAREAALSQLPSGQPGAGYKVPLLGDFQLENAAVALCMLQHLATVRGFERLADDAVLRAGFAGVSWPGRLQRVCLAVAPVPALPTGAAADGAPSQCKDASAPHGPPLNLDFILDGGHNEHAMARVGEAMDRLRSADGASAHHRRALFIYAGTDSRDVTAILRLLLRKGDALIAVPFSTPEGMPWIRHHPLSVVAAAARRVLGEECGDPEPRVSCCDSLEAALQVVASDPRLRGDDTLRVVCGSLYLVSDALRRQSSGAESVPGICVG